jgi:MarR family transcriptional regulator, organic hydroperoxide resistance regulator
MTEEELNTQVMDTLIELLKRMGSLGQSIGASFGLSGSDAMALHKIDGPVSMKELSQRIGCDASFITVIADSLERLGIAERVPSQRDRRVKNIVLTERGCEIRDEIIREVTARMPWGNTLDMSERKCFLGLLQKMLGRVEGGAPVTNVTSASS